MAAYTPSYSRRTRRVGSRLAKREEKRLLRQSIFLIILAIGVGLAFIFLVVPSSINFIFGLLGSEQVTQDDTLPPQVPVLKAPVDSTSHAQLTVSGFGEADSEVVLVMNGNEASRQKIEEEGSFSFEIELMEGENTISAYAVNDQEKESNLSREYQIVLDTEAPTLELESPHDGDTIELRENQLTTIRGVTEPKAKVYVNDRLTVADSKGVFSIQYQLKEGENKIKIKIQDKAANTIESEITLYFKY